MAGRMVRQWQQAFSGSGTRPQVWKRQCQILSCWQRHMGLRDGDPQSRAIEDAIAEMLTHNGPVWLMPVTKDENCYPMVAGKQCSDDWIARTL